MKHSLKVHKQSKFNRSRVLCNRNSRTSKIVYFTHSWEQVTCLSCLRLKSGRKKQAAPISGGGRYAFKQTPLTPAPICHLARIRDTTHWLTYCLLTPRNIGRPFHITTKRGKVTCIKCLKRITSLRIPGGKPIGLGEQALSL